MSEDAYRVLSIVAGGVGAATLAFLLNQLGAWYQRPAIVANLSVSTLTADGSSAVRLTVGETTHKKLVLVRLDLACTNRRGPVSTVVFLEGLHSFLQHEVGGDPATIPVDVRSEEKGVWIETSRPLYFGDKVTVTFVMSEECLVHLHWRGEGTARVLSAVVPAAPVYGLALATLRASVVSAAVVLAVTIAARLWAPAVAPPKLASQTTKLSDQQVANLLVSCMGDLDALTEEVREIQAKLQIKPVDDQPPPDP